MIAIKFDEAQKYNKNIFWSAELACIKRNKIYVYY